VFLQFNSKIRVTVRDRECTDLAVSCGGDVVETPAGSAVKVEAGLVFVDC
jgi:hypothetical protein